MTVVRAPEHKVYLKAAPNKDYHAMSTWCTEQFGKRWSAIDHRDGKWCCFWGGRENFGHYCWHFSNEEDLILFLLRWA